MISEGIKTYEDVERQYTEFYAWCSVCGLLCPPTTQDGAVVSEFAHFEEFGDYHKTHRGRIETHIIPNVQTEELS